MEKRLEGAIESTLYWSNAYQNSRNRFIETKDPKFLSRMDVNQTHVLSSLEYLRIVYEEETGKKVTTIGNLPEVHVLNERG